ncbi:ankyrin repeat domain-containing protein [Candidatus Babeliales bacterium]|jgi:hypothetical protein|nr:ankyrin repeat domain-containing protein [Candidatus Babeliales bacterium]
MPVQITKIALLFFWSAFFSYAVLCGAADTFKTQEVATDQEDCEPEEITHAHQERNKLFAAAAHGNVARLKEFLQSKSFDINTTTNKYGWTALHYAFYFLPKHKNAQAIVTLIDAEADLSIQECAGNTPAHFYTLWRHTSDYTKIINPILEKSPAAELKNYFGKTLRDLQAPHISTELPFNPETWTVTTCDCLAQAHGPISKRLIEENLPYFPKHELPYFKEVGSYQFNTSIIEFQFSKELLERLNKE